MRLNFLIQIYIMQKIFLVVRNENCEFVKAFSSKRNAEVYLNSKDNSTEYKIVTTKLCKSVEYAFNSDYQEQKEKLLREHNERMEQLKPESPPCGNGGRILTKKEMLEFFGH